MFFPRLGWAFPRPNDFKSADLRPLRDTFGDLQRHMTWPHAGVDVSGTVTNVYVGKTLTAINAPLKYNGFQLVRNNTIQVPREHNTYLAVGALGVFIDNVVTGKIQVGWLLNGAATAFTVDRVTGAVGDDPKMTVPLQLPVKKGDTLAVGALGPAANSGSFTAPSQAYVYFLPLV